MSPKSALNDDARTIQRHALSEVLARLGAPYRRSASRDGTTADYHYRDTWGYAPTFLVIIDDAGLVALTTACAII